MIDTRMTDLQLSQYCAAHIQLLDDAAKKLDTTWCHHDIVLNLLHEGKQQIKEFQKECTADCEVPFTPRDRRTQKYTDWVEVMRLAAFQYERFSQRKRARSEGLYSTLAALAATELAGSSPETILVPGCGPGRSVLDFAKIFPNANVIGLDYSLLSLIIGNRIVCGTEESLLLKRDVFSGEQISQALKIPGFGLKNAKFCLCDLVENELPTCDLIVCSNTVNLLPDHAAAIDTLCKSLRPSGFLVFADLIGWRLDRESSRRILHDDLSIRHAFENAGMRSIAQFSGVPYIETESDDQEVLYNEHFYFGQKQ